MINLIIQSVEDLINIVSGIEVSEPVATCIKTAHTKGEEAFANFCQTHLVGNAKKLHDPLTKLNIKSFENVGKTVQIQKKSKC